MSGILYIVATPIGNLEDITLRAIRVLSEVGVILAEDTRVTHKLLDFISRNQLPTTDNLSEELAKLRLQPTKPLVLSYHQHSSETKKLEILKMLMDGKNIALVTDAGTPGISDPGNELISFLLSQIPELKVVPIPGPSAITTALSVSGFDVSNFLFLGFWPKKKGKKSIEFIKSTKLNTVFYESPFRILKTLDLLEKELGSEVEVLIARELTKVYETLYRGTISEVKEKLISENRIKGEIVVIVNYE